jgi:hypothetical protein
LSFSSLVAGEAADLPALVVAAVVAVVGLEQTSAIR